MSYDLPCCVCINVCMYVCMYVYVYMCIYVYIGLCPNREIYAEIKFIVRKFS